jgi:hypothetical protein
MKARTKACYEIPYFSGIFYGDFQGEFLNSAGVGLPRGERGKKKAPSPEGALDLGN